MATSPCEGRAVALFDADAAAPCETSLAGIPLSARARVQTKCLEGDLAEVELMREDALASSRREGQPFETARLCARYARDRVYSYIHSELEIGPLAASFPKAHHILSRRSSGKGRVVQTTRGTDPEVALSPAEHMPARDAYD